MKRIHWPTSARHNQLMVKEFEQDPQAEIWLYLDLQKSVHYEKPHQIEERQPSRSFLASRQNFNCRRPRLNMRSTLRNRLRTIFSVSAAQLDMSARGKHLIVHSAERGERQEAKILETLAFVEGSGKLSIAALVTAQASQLPQGSSVVLVTSTVRPELLQAVDDRPGVASSNAKLPEESAGLVAD